MRKSVFIRSFWYLLGTAIFLAAPAHGRTQEQQGDQVGLKKAFDASYKQLNDLFSGAERATKDDKKHADAAAQWYVYRFNIKFFVTPTKDSPNPVDRMHREFHEKVAELMDKKNGDDKREFRKMFGVALVESTRNVLGSHDIKSDPSTVIHAAQMLPDMARLKQDEVSAYLCELAKDEKNKVMQLYAVKALKETMPISIQPDPDDFAGVNLHNARKARDIKNVDTLRQFIERPVNTAGMSHEEVKAIIFIRREAIISLAQAGAPAVVAIPNKKMAVPPEGAVAATLLNVLAGKLQPPPTLSEKVEAALGICAMKYPFMPDYDPQLGIFLVAKTLDEFVADYRKDWAKFKGGKNLPYLPYLGDARRWQAGLKELAANTPNPASKSAKGLEASSTQILKAIIGPNPKDKYKNIEDEDVNQLKTLIPRLQPSNENPFKNMKLQNPLGK